MSKPVKELITRELASRYGQATNAVWVELVGVDGITTNEFRRALRGRHMRLEVVKTSLLRRAVSGAPLGRLAEALTGPAALITGGESAVEVAKVLEEWLPKLPQLKMRGALLDGEFLDASRVKDLSRMPSKRDMQGRVVGCVRAPGANLAAALLSGGGRIAGCLKALIEKLEQNAPVARAG